MKKIVSTSKHLSKHLTSSKKPAKESSTTSRQSASPKESVKQTATSKPSSGSSAKPSAKSSTASKKPHTIDAATWLKQPDIADAPLVEGLFNKGEVVALVGSSKSDKALLAAQAHVCVGAGVPLLGHEVSRAQTCYVFGEHSAATLERRILGVCKALRVDPEALRGNVCLDATQGGVGLADVLATCKAHGCEVAIIDPLYSVAHIDETDVAECCELVDTLRQFNREGITLIVVCHFPYDVRRRDPYALALIDMVSRSPILARQPESIVGVMPSVTDENARVIYSIARNYPPRDPFAVKVEDGAFKCAPEVPLFPLSHREKIEAKRRRHREENRARLEDLRNVKRNGNAE